MKDTPSYISWKRMHPTMMKESNTPGIPTSTSRNSKDGRYETKTIQSCRAAPADVV
jgi:hypothetical protein